MHINLHHLAYVVAAAEKGSVTEAAGELGVSQPAISAAVKGFENAFGYRLFVRRPAHGLSLTPSGRQFVRHARRLLDDTRSFERQAMGLGQEIDGDVHVACYFITAPFFMPPVFKALARSHPGMSIRLHEGDMVEVIQFLKNGTADLALTYDQYPDSAITFERLFEVRPHVLLSANDPLAGSDVISLEQLADKPMVLLDLPVAHDYFQNLFSIHGLQPTIQYRLKTFELVRSVVGTGIGFSFGLLPLKTNRTYDGQSLVSRPLKEEVPNPSVCLAFAKQSLPTRLVQAFADECRRVFKSGISAAVEVE